MATPSWKDTSVIGGMPCKQEWTCWKCDRHCQVITSLSANPPTHCPDSHEE